MNLYNIITQNLSCSMFWGEGTLIRDNVPAVLNWQPLQETSGGFWIPPEFMKERFWKHYRPDSMQPLFFVEEGTQYDQRIWVDEYDIRAYLMGWKNVPVFRIKRIEFITRNATEFKKIDYKDVDCWYLIPGSLTGETEKTDQISIELKIPVFTEAFTTDILLLRENLEEMVVSIYTGFFELSPFTAIQISEYQQLQSERTKDYQSAFNMGYSVLSDLLMLLTRQNLNPVWQVIRHFPDKPDSWQDYYFFNEQLNRRNLIQQETSLFWRKKSFTELYAKFMNRKLPLFRHTLRDTGRFSDLLQIEDMIDRIRLGIGVVNRMIGWNGEDIDRWPILLKETLERYHTEVIERFIIDKHLEQSVQINNWNILAWELESLYSLVDGSTPAGSWYKGKEIKQRHDLLLELIAELILGKHFSEN